MDCRIITSLPHDRYTELLQMIHSSFEEHRLNGLNFTCSSYTLTDIKEKILSGAYFIVLSQTNEIIGITSCTLDLKRETAYANISAVSPKAKRMGIGSRLLKERTEFLKKEGIKSLFADTAVNAVSSVEWHKKSGFHIIGLESFKSTNYYSYIFRQDLYDRPAIITRFYYPLRFAMSYIICHLTKNENGAYTRLGNLLKAILG